jgi:hypothetical protein
MPGESKRAGWKGFHTLNPAQTPANSRNKLIHMFSFDYCAPDLKPPYRMLLARNAQLRPTAI